MRYVARPIRCGRSARPVRREEELKPMSSLYPYHSGVSPFSPGPWAKEGVAKVPFLKGVGKSRNGLLKRG